MDISITRDKCKFYVKPDDRKVICVLKVSSYLLFDFIRETSALPIGWLPTDDEIALNGTYTGIATCDPMDTWDEERGRTIAFIKAKRKFCRNFFNTLKRYVNFLDGNIDNMLNTLNAIGSAWTHNLQTLEEELDME